jgi:hypothetical protein
MKRLKDILYEIYLVFYERFWWKKIFFGSNIELLNNIQEKKRLRNQGKNRIKVLFIPGYYFATPHKYIDLILSMGLINRDAELLYLKVGYFFKNECPFFCGDKRIERLIKLFKNNFQEKIIWTKLLGVSRIKMRSNKESREIIKSVNKELNELSFDKILNYEYNNINIGFEASIVVKNLYYLIELHEGHKKLLIHHIINCIRYIICIDDIIKKFNPDRIIGNVGIYYRWSIPFFLSQKNNIPYYSYFLSERPNSFILSKNNNVLGKTLSGSEIEFVSQMLNLNDALIGKLRNLLVNYRTSKMFSHYADYYLPKKNGDTHDDRVILKRLEDRTKINILVVCNVGFDATVFQKNKIFKDYENFLSTISDFSKKFTNYNFYLKIHPAEHIFVERKIKFQSSSDFIDLSGDNIIVIPSNTSIQKEAILSYSDAVITYTSSLALESALFVQNVFDSSISHYSELDFFKRNNSFDDLRNFLQNISKSKETLNLDNQIVIYSMYFNYVSQLDLGIFVASDLFPSAKFVDNLNLRKILENKTLNSLVDCVIEDDTIFNLHKERIGNLKDLINE